MKQPLAQCRLYTFVDTAYLHDRRPEEVAQQLCDGGADLIQIRAKDRSPEEVQAMAETILPITEQADVWLVINDHLDATRRVGASLCHMGQEDFFHAGYTHVDQLAPEDNAPEIGLSSHAPAQAKRAVDAGAAYVAVGPVFATDTKPGAQPVTVDYVRWAASNVSIPWFAIGGINLDNLDQVLIAGARRICVVSAILNSPNLVQTCQMFKTRLATFSLL